MRILKCHITNFGCYSDQSFDLSTKLNSFFLKNGEGKTTLATFIKAMFYSLKKSSKDSYERKHYKPYSGGEYGGSLEIELNGEKYRIERTFADSPTKDTLKIYDSNGVQQTIFLNKQLSLLQGEDSSFLGEMIFGIDVDAFQRCNFISSEDLDFSNNESIKMKIGNIVIDKDRENSYQETYDSIVEFDLRDKKPTASKNENAYPYRIKELEKENKEKKIEIQELNQLESSLQGLYEERDGIKQELNEIEAKQKAFSKIHELKGKMTTVEELKKEIQDKDDFIDDINKKYNSSIPSKEELDSLNDGIIKYNKCVALDDSYRITPAEIERLEGLNGKVVADEDYSVMADANSKLSSTLTGIGIVQIDENRYKQLKAKFDDKTIKNELVLEQAYIEYKTVASQMKNFDGNYQSTNKDYPSENVLSQIDSEIKEYNEAQKELDAFNVPYKEPASFVKILLIIITFGIYFVRLNKKKKEHQAILNKKEELVSQKAKELNTFFEKYGKTNGTYELKIAELRDEISKYEKSKDENAEKRKKHEEVSKVVDEKKRNLINYFSFFGYMISDVDDAYNTYKKDLQTYNSMVKDDARNKQINKEIQENKSNYLNRIDAVLTKYSINRRENFSAQLDEIKSDIEFFKKYNPVYTNKKANLEEKSKYEQNIIMILRTHDIDYKSTDIISCCKNLIEEILKYNKAKENKIELIEKREKFIKDNNLTGFVAENVEGDENQLRELHELKNSELDKKEDEINQIETRISRREFLGDEINNNLDLIEDYKQKISIAQLAAKALEDAQGEMEAKFIGPIKDSFVTYAKQIHEKIASNINMNYDYEIKYDVKGQLRDSKDLSDGERAIMMLALRFAVLDSIYKNHDSIIVLDDPFESLDDEKLSKAKELIKTLSEEWQIVYFTCHESRTIS